MTQDICRQEVLQIGAVELTLEAECHIEIKPNYRIFSAGCGTGELECYLAKKYHCLIDAIDQNQDYITRAQDKAIQKEVAKYARFFVGDISKTDYPEHTFDIVYTSGGLSGIREIDNSFLSEFKRILKDDGKVVLIGTTWTKDNVPEDIKKMWHIRIEDKWNVDFLQPSEIDNFFKKAGFRVVFLKIADEPSWWENYCNDMIKAKIYKLEQPDADFSIWERFRKEYKATKGYLGVTLFILEKQKN